MTINLTFLSLAMSMALLAGCSETPAEPVSSQSAEPAASYTQADAQSAALKHAGLTEADVTFVHTELDRDDGRQVYDVEFYTKDFKEFDYEIDAKTGEVLSFDQDADGFTPPATSPAAGTNTITEEDAKQIALSKIPGAVANDIREFKLDRDDGKTYYEGTILFEKMAYEFEIDAATGDIVEWDAESIYD